MTTGTIALEKPLTIVPDIEKDIWKAWSKRRKLWAIHNNNASVLGHSCLRHLVYRRTVPLEQKEVHDTSLQFIFDGGSYLQRFAELMLEEAGWSLHHEERSLDMPQFRDLRITGRMDCAISKDGGKTKVPIEIKTSSSHVWEKITDFEGLKTADQPWLRKYPAQIQLYMFMVECEVGAFFFLNKQTFQPKIVWCNLDYEYVEEILQKAEAINKHVDEGTLPDRIPYDEDECGMCEFNTATLCNAGESWGEGARIITDEKLLADIAEWYRLKGAHNEYGKLDRKLKPKFRDVPEIIAGDIIITGKAYPIKERAAVPATTGWRVSVRKIGGDGNGEKS